MKKFIFAVAFAGLFAVNITKADTVCCNAPQVEVTETTEVDEVPAEVVEFQAVDIDALPASVKDAVAAKGDGYAIKGAAVADKAGAKVYKVVVAAPDGTVAEVLYDEAGVDVKA